MFGRFSAGMSVDKTSFEIRLANKKTKYKKMEPALVLIEQISSKHCVFRRISFACKYLGITLGNH
jgi:hypothetical protein